MSPETPRLALQAGAGLPLSELAAGYLTEYLDKIELAVAGLDEAQIWARTGERTNSIANLLLHLCGNLSLWVRASLGNRRYVRDRAAEFAADRICSKAELLDSLRLVVTDSCKVLSLMDADRLGKRLEVQGYETDGRGVVLHAVEHMSYHTGQIVLLAKQALPQGGELEFYPHHRGE